MTKKEVIAKIQKILDKDPQFKDTKLTVVFKDKKKKTAT